MTSGPEFDKAREMAMAYIGIDRNKSSGRVRRNLLQKGLDPSLADQAVRYYQELDYINDRRAARKVAARYQGRRLRSQRAMVDVFIQNGIETHLAREAAASLDPDPVTASRLCLAHFDRPQDGDQAAMMKLLARRGYPSGLARDVIRSLMKNDGQTKPGPDLDEDYEP